MWSGRYCAVCAPSAKSNIEFQQVIFLMSLIKGSN